MSAKINKKNNFYWLSQKNALEREYSELKKKAERVLLKGIIAIIVWGAVALFIHSKGISPVAVIRITIAVIIYFFATVCMSLTSYRKIKNTHSLGVIKYAELSENEKQLIENDIALGDVIGDVVLGSKYVYVTSHMFDFFQYKDILWLHEVAINREPTTEAAEIIDDDENVSLAALYMLYKSEGDFYSAYISLSRNAINVQEILDIVAEKNPAADIGYSDEKRDHYKAYVENSRK